MNQHYSNVDARTWGSLHRRQEEEESSKKSDAYVRRNIRRWRPVEKKRQISTRLEQWTIDEGNTSVSQQHRHNRKWNGTTENKTEDRQRPDIGRRQPHTITEYQATPFITAVCLHDSIFSKKSCATNGRWKCLIMMQSAYYFSACFPRFSIMVERKLRRMSFSLIGDFEESSSETCCTETEANNARQEIELRGLEL